MANKKNYKNVNNQNDYITNPQEFPEFEEVMPKDQQDEQENAQLEEFVENQKVKPKAKKAPRDAHQKSDEEIEKTIPTRVTRKQRAQDEQSAQFDEEYEAEEQDQEGMQTAIITRAMAEQNPFEQQQEQIESIQRKINYGFVGLVAAVVLLLVNVIPAFIPDSAQAEPESLVTAAVAEEPEIAIRDYHKHKIIDDFTQCWNRRDYRGLYSFMGKTVRQSVSPREFKRQCKQIFPLGTINSSKFSSAEPEGTFMSKEVYNVRYAALIDGVESSIMFTAFIDEFGPEILRFDIRKGVPID